MTRAESVPLTAAVVTLKPTLVAPAGTVTLGGMLTTGEPAASSVTTEPPAGAGMLSVTLAVAVSPPRTVAGVIVSVLTAGVGAGVATGTGVAVGAGALPEAVSLTTKASSPFEAFWKPPAMGKAA